MTNAELDAAGISYLTTTRDELPPLSVWDRAQLVPIARRTERPGLLDVDFILPANSEVLVEQLDDDVRDGGRTRCSQRARARSRGSMI